MPSEAFFQEMLPKMRKQYPKYSEERLRKIIAGIYFKQHPEERKDMSSSRDSQGIVTTKFNPADL